MTRQSLAVSLTSTSSVARRGEEWVCVSTFFDPSLLFLSFFLFSSLRLRLFCLPSPSHLPALLCFSPSLPLSLSLPLLLSPSLYLLCRRFNSLLLPLSSSPPLPLSALLPSSSPLCPCSYLGGLRLLQATCKKFYQYCAQHGSV